MYLLGPPSKILPWKEQRFRCVYFVSPKRASRCETASAARLLQRIVRRAVSRAPSRFGESAASTCRQVLALMTIPQRHSFSSFAIASVKRPGVVTLRNERDPGHLPSCDNEFGAELISHLPFPHQCVVSLNQEAASRLPQIKWHIALYGEGRRPILAKGTRPVGRRATLFWRFRFTLLRGKIYDLPSVKSGVQRPEARSHQGDCKCHRSH